MTSGVMTMAYGRNEYIRMAKGLARSLRLHSPGTPVALVTDRDATSLRRWFDVVIPLNPWFGTGLAHKLHLDAYNPFDRTLFIDSDILVYRPLTALWEKFEPGCGVGIFATQMALTDPHYAVDDLRHFMELLSLRRMVMTNTGIVYLEASSKGEKVFDTARRISQRADELGVRRHPAGSFNDEPIIAAAAVLEDAALVAPGQPPIFSLGALGVTGMSEINVLRQRSRQKFLGADAEPVAIHFNVESQQSWVYKRELRRLELGGVLGRTGLASLMVAPSRAVHGEASARRRITRVRLRSVARRLLRTPLADPLLPVGLYARLSSTDAAGLVARVARWRWNGRPFRFVQVGSNDGKTGDPLHATIMRRPVSGILIEPIPELFEKLRRTYEGKRGLKFVNVAIDREPGTRTLYFVRPRSGDPLWAALLASFHEEIVLSHRDEIEDLEQRVESVPVSCRTLDSVMLEHHLRRFDLLHIDAEGADYEILQSIDLSGAKAPRFLLFEQKHLGSDLPSALDLVYRAGYRTVDLGMDVFAYRSRFATLRCAASRWRV